MLTEGGELLRSSWSEKNGTRNKKRKNLEASSCWIRVAYRVNSIIGLDLAEFSKTQWPERNLMPSTAVPLDGGVSSETPSLFPANARISSSFSLSIVVRRNVYNHPNGEKRTQGPFVWSARSPVPSISGRLSVLQCPPPKDRWSNEKWTLIYWNTFMFCIESCWILPPFCIA